MAVTCLWHAHIPSTSTCNNCARSVRTLNARIAPLDCAESAVWARAHAQSCRVRIAASGGSREPHQRTFVGRLVGRAARARTTTGPSASQCGTVPEGVARRDRLSIF